MPVRHGRMAVSPFTFYRGAARIMAADLADTPVAGLDAQLCGDAHLSNFGLFASPERRLLFDLNDFDETLPGPFEWDVKRMAASFTIAARNNGFSKADARAATQAAVTAYREAMAEFAQMPTMDIWYAHLDEDELMGRDPQHGGQDEERSQGGEGEEGRRRTRSRRSWPSWRRSGRGRSPRRRTPGTVCLLCPSSANWPTGSTRSSASRRSSFRPATWPPPTACPRTRSSR